VISISARYRNKGFYVCNSRIFVFSELVRAGLSNQLLDRCCISTNKTDAFTAYILLIFKHISKWLAAAFLYTVCGAQKREFHEIFNLYFFTDPESSLIWHFASFFLLEEKFEPHTACTQIRKIIRNYQISSSYLVRPFAKLEDRFVVCSLFRTSILEYVVPKACLQSAIKITFCQLLNYRTFSTVRHKNPTRFHIFRQGGLQIANPQISTNIAQLRHKSVLKEDFLLCTNLTRASPVCDFCR
jgi:hypothetical protein